MTFAAALVVLAALAEVLAGQSADDALKRLAFEQFKQRNDFAMCIE